MKTGIIYSAYCECENKIYIGQSTKKISIREREHLYNAKNNSKTYFHRALLKHKFTFSVLEEIQGDNIYDVLNEREKYWIKFYKSNDENYGYNLQEGGRKSYLSKNKLIKHKQETIEKIRKSVSGEKNPMYGKSIYDRWVELYGIDVADEKMIEYVNKHKLSHSNEKNGMFGKKQKEETKILISQRAKQRVGKKASRYVKVDEYKLKDLLNSGLKAKELADIFKVSEYVIRKRIKEIN